MPAFSCLGNSSTCWGLGVECLQPSLDISGKLCVFSSCISSSSSVQVSCRICQRSMQTFDSGGTMLNGGSWTSYSSQHVDRCSLALSHQKRSHHGKFGRLCAQGSAISTFNPLAALRCVMQTEVLFLSLSGSSRDNSSVFDRGLTAMFEELGRLVHSRGCTKQCHICHLISWFLVHLFSIDLAWHIIGIYHSAISVF